MSTLFRVSSIDSKGFVEHEWFPTLFTANDRANDLVVLGREGVDFEEVEVPWDHLADLIHWLNHTPNSPPLKEDHPMCDPVTKPAYVTAGETEYKASQQRAHEMLKALDTPLGVFTYDPNKDLADTPVVRATDLLSKAASIMEERGKQYDKPEGERSMGQTVDIFNLFHGTKLTEAQGWHFMQILKDVRLFQRPGYHADSAEDGVAYSSLKAEAKAKETP